MRRLTTHLSILGAAASALSLATPAWADGGPRVEGEWLLEFSNDTTVTSDDPAAELSDTYLKSEAAIGWFLNDHVSVQAQFTFEPVLDPTDDRVFEDQGLFAEQLYFQVEYEPVRFFAGKFNPSFGKAFELGPGVYGNEFGEEYEITEKLGFGAALTGKGTAFGTLELTANVYHADTSGLSNSVFTSRGKASLSDGGASNTADLDSVSVTLDGSDIPGLPGIAYHLGYRYQAAGRLIDDEDEHGFVAGLYGEHELGGGYGLVWIGEVAYLDGVGGYTPGIPDPVTDDFNAPGRGIDSVTYATLGATVTYDIYNLALAYTGRFHGDDGRAGDPADGFEDYQLSVSAGAELSHGWALDVGYKFLHDQDVDSHTIGARLAKTLTFNTGE